MVEIYDVRIRGYARYLNAAAPHFSHRTNLGCERGSSGISVPVFKFFLAPFGHTTVALQCGAPTLAAVFVNADLFFYHDQRESSSEVFFFILLLYNRCVVLLRPAFRAKKKDSNERGRPFREWECS